MSVSLSIIFNGYQSFLGNGLPNSGGYIYTYLAGTTTPATTYTNNGGAIANPNPIPLSASGNPLNPIWLTDGVAYKMVVVDKNLAQVPNATFDNVTGSAGGIFSFLLTLAASAGSSLIGFIQAGAGAVLRTVQSKLRDTISVKDFGAKGDDATDDSAAILAAVASLGAAGGCVQFPAGTYRITPTTMTGLINVTLCGAGRNNTIIRLTTAGIGMRFVDCQWLTLRHLTFGPTGTPQSLIGAIGVQLDGNSSNAVIEECGFFSFQGGGLNVNGLPGAAQSGNQILNNYFLGNSGNQLRFANSNDFHIEGNQYGILGGIPSAAIGCLLENASAGNYTNNYHWENVIGFKSLNSFYNRILGNRFEENKREGFYMQSANNCIISGNTFHTNSKETYGMYDNAYFSNLVQCVISNNTSFDFSDFTFGHRYGMYITNFCDGVTIRANKAADGYVTGPIYVDPLSVNTNHDTALSICLTSQFAAAGAGTFLGQNGQSSVELSGSWTPGRRAVVSSFFVNTSAAPGASQSYTFTLYKNNVATAMTGTITGTTNFAVEVGGPVSSPVLIAERDRISLRVESSGGSAATYVVGAIKLTEF